MEFISGIKRQLREGKLTPEPAAEILQVFARDEANDVWLWLPMDDALLDATCAAFQNLPPAVHLRAGDALHLTCARVQGNLQRKFQVLKQVIAVVKSSFATLWPRILELLPSGYNAAAVAELFRHLDLSQLQQPFDLLASLGH